MAYNDPYREWDNSVSSCHRKAHACWGKPCQAIML